MPATARPRTSPSPRASNRSAMRTASRRIGEDCPRVAALTSANGARGGLFIPLRAAGCSSLLMARASDPAACSCEVRAAGSDEFALSPHKLAGAVKTKKLRAFHHGGANHDTERPA
jgi:hypothetical protein